MEQNKINKEPELIIIPNNNCKFNSKNSSLQSNFKNFRSYINSIRKKAKPPPEIDRNDPVRMQQLRQKFIDTAKSLIGIPYGKKYLINHPEYKGNLFLDCCGLIRHVVKLLENDFGFCLDRWNQSYQYDILPEEIKFEEMQPGDLIFYSSPKEQFKKKPRIHNMTHVEIFLGEGEKSLGSRNKKSTVKIFESYKFKGDKYKHIEYHFKSIDTWLKGIHKSFCSEHKWHEGKILLLDKEKVNKYSAFYEGNNDDYNENDESDDIEDEDINNENIENK